MVSHTIIVEISRYPLSPASSIVFLRTRYSSRMLQCEVDEDILGLNSSGARRGIFRLGDCHEGNRLLPVPYCNFGSLGSVSCHAELLWYHDQLCSIPHTVLWMLNARGLLAIRTGHPPNPPGACTLTSLCRATCRPSAAALRSRWPMAHGSEMLDARSRTLGVIVVMVCRLEHER